MYKYPVITIDGPSGSGKGTISKMLAERLGWHLLDSGALYRILAFLYRVQLGSENLSQLSINESILEQLAIKMEVKFIQDKIFVNDKEEDVSKFIRTESCGNLASKIAVYPKVRAALLVKQREFLQSPGLVADGRDMGTVVFPNAILKFFLEADVKIRGLRRHTQLKEMGVDVKLQSLIGELSVRDLRDMQRPIANLQVPQDAILIDTAAMTINEVFAMVMEQVILII